MVDWPMVYDALANRPERMATAPGESVSARRERDPNGELAERVPAGYGAACGIAGEGPRTPRARLGMVSTLRSAWLRRSRT